MISSLFLAIFAGNAWLFGGGIETIKTGGDIGTLIKCRAYLAWHDLLFSFRRVFFAAGSKVFTLFYFYMRYFVRIPLQLR